MGTTSNALAPEAHVDLQISLDRLRDLEDRCRDALRQLASGKLSREAYFSILDQQLEAQKRWVAQQRKYLGHRRREMLDH